MCTFVQRLSQEFGDQASVYAAAMKEQAIDGKTLLDLSSANPIADNKLKELGLTKMGHRMKLKSCIRASDRRQGTAALECGESHCIKCRGVCLRDEGRVGVCEHLVSVRGYTCMVHMHAGDCGGG